MRSPEDKKEPLMRRLENSGPGKAIYYVGLAAGASAALGGTAVLAYKWDEIRVELAAILSDVDEPAIDEAIETPSTETVPTTVEPPPTVEATPAKPLPTGWELAPEVFSTGSAPQQEAAVKEKDACAAYTFECKGGVFPGGDHFAYVTGCPKPGVDWTGWERGKTVDVKMADGKFYEKNMLAPADLCAQIPTVNGRVVHWLNRFLV